MPKSNSIDPCQSVTVFLNLRVDDGRAGLDLLYADGHVYELEKEVAAEERDLDLIRRTPRLATRGDFVRNGPETERWSLSCLSIEAGLSLRRAFD